MQGQLYQGGGCMCAIASPAYLASKPELKAPQDLLVQQCTDFRLPTFGGFYAWEFERDGRECGKPTDF